MPEKLPKLIEDLLYAEEHRLLNDSIGRAMKRAIGCGVADRFIMDFVDQRVRTHRIRQAFTGPFPMPKLTRGDFLIGLDLRGRPLFCPSQFFGEPSLTVGSTGCGKTTKSRFWLLQLAAKNACWGLDMRKREFAILRPYLARIGVSLRVVPARQLKLNPLQVPYRTDPREYAPLIAEILVSALKSPPRATKLLHATILQVYAECGVLDGTERYPTLFDLRETVAADRGANRQAQQAVLDSLDPVLRSIPEVLAYRYGWTTHALARRHIIFEFGGISETDKDLLVNTLVLGEFVSRISQGISNPKMDLYICCDEAARLVRSSDDCMSDLITVVRGTGVSLDFALQSAELSKSIMSNSPNKFLGRCSSYSDLEVIGASMGLTRDQRRWVTKNLVPGMFVGQLGQGDWREPFVFRIPKMNFKRPNPTEPAHGGPMGTLPG